MVASVDVRPGQNGRCWGGRLGGNSTPEDGRARILYISVGPYRSVSATWFARDIELVETTSARGEGSGGPNGRDNIVYCLAGRGRVGLVQQ